MPQQRLTVPRWLAVLATIAAVLGLVMSTGAPARAAPTITPGRSVTVPVSEAETSWSFSARPDDRAVVAVTASALSGESRSVGFFLRRGATEITLGGTAGAPDLLDDAPPLPRAGTWDLVMRGFGDVSGTLTFTLRLVRDTTTAATVDRAQTVRHTTPGAAVRLTFSGTRGRLMVLDLTAQDLTAALTTPAVNATLLRPDGTEATRYWQLQPQFWDEFTLDASGRWTLVLDPVEDTTGTQTLAVRLPTPIRRSATQGRIDVQVPTPGRTVQLSVQGTRGRPFAAEALSSRWTSARWPDLAGASVFVRTPDGRFFASLLGPGDRYGVTPPLPVTGRYTIEIDPTLDTVGRVALQLDQGTTSAVTGLPTAAAVDVGPADIRRFRFPATQGRPLGITLGAATWRSTSDRAVDVAVLRPDGSVLQQWDDVSPVPTYLETPPLDRAGTWTLQIAAARASSGVITVTAAQPSTTAAPITVGVPTQIGVTTPGGRARVTFSGTAGQHVALDRTVVDWRTADGQPAAAVATLLRPDGTPLGDFTGTSAPGWGYRQTLDATGTWTIEFAPENGATGGETVVLDRWTPEPLQPLTLSQATAFATPQRGHYSEYTFALTGPSRNVAWSVDAPGLRRVVLRVVLPTGTVRTVTALPELGITNGTIDLPALSGDYRLIVDTADAVGSGTVTLQ